MLEKPNMRPVECSFCGKRPHEVRKLIAGPRHVYICDECAGFCMEIVAELDADSRLRDRMKERGEIIVSQQEADRLTWMRTWTVGTATPEPSHE